MSETPGSVGIDRSGREPGQQRQGEDRAVGAGMKRPSVYELWVQAGGNDGTYDRERFTQLMREFGHLLDTGGDPRDETGLPCGWRPAARGDGSS